jgi:hypothetical protein
MSSNANSNANANSDSNANTQVSTASTKKYETPTVTEVWDEQIGTRGVYLLELG